MADVINLDRLEECTGGDKEFADELLDEFANLLCDELAKLGRACEAGDIQESRFVAHAIKGASASVGVEALSAAAGRLEAYAKEGDVPAVRATLVELERQAARFLGWYESPDRAA